MTELVFCSASGHILKTPHGLREETVQWCERCDSNRWVRERHPDRPFSGSRACTLRRRWHSVPRVQSRADHHRTGICRKRLEGVKIRAKMRLLLLKAFFSDAVT